MNFGEQILDEKEQDAAELAQKLTDLLQEIEDKEATMQAESEEVDALTEDLKNVSLPFSSDAFHDAEFQVCSDSSALKSRTSSLTWKRGTSVSTNSSRTLRTTTRSSRRSS